MNATTSLGYLVNQTSDDSISSAITSVNHDDFPAGEVLIRVTHSSLNYKDALAAKGHRGVIRSLPHIPGIDSVGQVVASKSPAWEVGDEVLVTGYGLGSERWGGWCEHIRVPADWGVRRPPELSAVEAMTLGTAGFTAAQSVSSLQLHGIVPDKGPIVVTGASGGVGSLAVAILAKIGYQVTAVTGTAAAHDMLRELGAAEILDRADVSDDSGKPLLDTKWAGAVDTVGGNTLATIVRSMQHRGCVTACGLVGGHELALTVYPFLLRGITLDGIDSAACPMPTRLDIWKYLNSAWKPDKLDSLRSEISLYELDDYVIRMLAGETTGRIVVNLGTNSSRMLEDSSDG